MPCPDPGHRGGCARSADGPAPVRRRGTRSAADRRCADELPTSWPSGPGARAAPRLPRLAATPLTACLRRGDRIPVADDPGYRRRLLMGSRSPDVTWHAGRVEREGRPSRGATVWFTGLPSSGKSTIAAVVEERLVRAGRPAYRARRGQPATRSERRSRLLPPDGPLREHAAGPCEVVGPLRRRRASWRSSRWYRRSHRRRRAREAARTGPGCRSPRSGSSKRRPRSASGAIPRACGRRRGPGRSRASRAWTIPMSCSTTVAST